MTSHPVSLRPKKILTLLSKLWVPIPSGPFPLGFPSKFSTQSVPAHECYIIVPRHYYLYNLPRYAGFYREVLVSFCLNPNLEDHPRSAVGDWIFDIFAVCLLRRQPKDAQRFSDRQPLTTREVEHHLVLKLTLSTTYTLISSFRLVQNVVCFLLGDSPASDLYIPTFRNTLSVPSSKAGVKWY